MMLRIFSITVSDNNLTILANYCEGEGNLEDAIAVVESHTGLKFRGLHVNDTASAGSTITVYATVDKVEIDDDAIDWQIHPGIDCHCGTTPVRVSVSLGCSRIDKVRSNYGGLVRFTDTTYEDMLMEHLYHYINQYVDCKLNKGTIWFNGNMDYLDIGLRLNRQRKPDGGQSLRISMTHHPIPVVYKGQSIIAIDRKMVSDISTDVNNLELTVCASAKYHGRLMVNTQCETAFIVLDDYTPINGYSISTDNPYTAIFTANSLAYDKRLIGDIRRLPVDINCMMHLC